MFTTTFDFDWDPKKARSNLERHAITFRLAASVFRETTRMRRDSGLL